MRVRFSILLTLWPTVFRNVLAACDNYGVDIGTACTCPPGFGGTDCSLPTCGGTIYDGPSRPTLQPQNGLPYGNSSECTCPDGWGGVGCNVCKSASACSSAYTSRFGDTLPGSSGDITCSTSPKVYAVGQMSCTVNNPTLQSLFPGATTFTILRNLDPSNTLAANVSSFGDSGSLLAQLWFNGEEQFYCSANFCTQDASNNPSDWKCHNLRCACHEKAKLCGINPTISLSTTINGLNGDLEIKCSAGANGSTQCAFLQDTIQSIFGSSGLLMEDCQFGECVTQSVIDSASGSSENPTTTSVNNDPGFHPNIPSKALEAIPFSKLLGSATFCLLVAGFLI
ncbi:hypothetical protein CPB86DRAFT_780630 [Serendipita vermifera]|nr:hypothetical protein CPB86DRAFT_780630 [Serendipita vermifera]